LDGSSFAERAIPVAAAFADRLGATVRLFSAVANEAAVAEREDHLASLGAAAPGAGPRTVDRAVVVDADAAGAILAELGRLDDAIGCMASHGRGRTAALVGSVTTDVVARAHEPLLVVGPAAGGPTAGGPNAGGSGVVACVDEHPASARLITVALKWARLLGGQAVAIAAAEPVPPGLDRKPERRAFGPDGDVQAYLDSLTSSLGPDGSEVGTQVVFDAISPADGILEYLGDNPPALVVVGSRARKGLALAVFGSVSSAIVHSSSAPVLVDPGAERRTQGSGGS
jgi:nucleotide-binding universal stress UspA family protein